jgi:PRTRC genetic system ThiF family protein
MFELNTEYMNARKVLLPVVENVNLVLIGCGGTGSWLAPSIVRFAKLLVEKFDKDVRIVFVDPDKVEEKNVYRQNFCQAEIGMNKAQALAFRYGLAWGMDILAIEEPFKASMSFPNTGRAKYLTVLIGCVDNGAARQEIKSRVLSSIGNGEVRWWLDCGNKKTVGQVLIGRGLGSDEDPLAFDGFCTWAPSPALQHPELVMTDDDLESLPEPDANLSCAELAMRGSQSLSINCKMAATAGEMLGKLLLTNDLEYYAAYIDQSTGETRRFITDEAIEGFMTKVKQ